MARRAHQAECLQSRTVFITNIPFKMSEAEIRGWLSEGGAITVLRLGKDKETARPLGWGHVQFATAAQAKAAVERCDKREFHSRVLRVAPGRPDEKFQFE